MEAIIAGIFKARPVKQVIPPIKAKLVTTGTIASMVNRKFLNNKAVKPKVAKSAKSDRKENSLVSARETCWEKFLRETRNVPG